MTIFDLVLLIILGGFTLFGLWFGFIHALGALVGIVAGAFVAGHYYTSVASWGSFIWGAGDLGYILSFILILILVDRLVGLVFYLLDRIFKFIAIIPFLKSINHLVGAVLGFLEGAFAVGLILYFLSRYPINEWLTAQLIGSQVAPWLVGISNVLVPLLPEIVQQLKSVI